MTSWQNICHKPKLLVKNLIKFNKIKSFITFDVVSHQL